MSPYLYIAIMLCLTVAGSLFSGYLTFHKIITKTCAFNEPCPMFLGKSACAFGFAFFISMLIAVLGTYAGYLSSSTLTPVLIAVSFIGIVFAGQFVIPELNELFHGVKHHYRLGLSTCSYGMFFFILIFIISLMSLV